MKDERLENISDKIRHGIPVDFMEALEAIEYQEKLKQEKRERNVLFKLRKFFKTK